MGEFLQKDYAQSRTDADNIKASADKIMGIFDSIDSTMKKLYGDNWQSSGAVESSERYKELRQNYEKFYNQVDAMHKHVHKVTTSNENTDTTVSNTMKEI